MVFDSISVISQWPVHLSMLSWSSFNQYSAQYFFPSHWLLSLITIVKTTDSGERGMNHVTMTIINPRKEHWLSLESNQRPPVLMSATFRLSYGAQRLWESEVLKILWEKEKMLLPAFSPFPTIFSLLSKENSIIWATMKLSSANVINLDKATILLCSKRFSYEGHYYVVKGSVTRVIIM